MTIVLLSTHHIGVLQQQRVCTERCAPRPTLVVRVRRFVVTAARAAARRALVCWSAVRFRGRGYVPLLPCENEEDSFVSRLPRASELEIREKNRALNAKQERTLLFYT